MTEEEDECDYMSDMFVTTSTDKRPGLVSGKIAKKYEKEKKKAELNQRRNMKPRKVVEKETRDKGLETKIGDDNKGFAILKKMGYNPGEGLGKNKSGRTDPVPISIKLGRTGIGKDAHEKRKREVREKYKIIIMQKRRKYNENLQVDFRARMRGKFAEKQYEKDLRKSQKVCYQLESEDGIESPEFDFFWPLEVFGGNEDEEEAGDAKEEADDSEEYSV